jgi:hypothetical protein
VPRLCAEIRAHAEENRRLKDALGRTWTEPMASVQRALLASRRRTTERCVLRAWLRGRFHLEKPLREGSYPGMEWDRRRYHQRVACELGARLETAVEVDR